MSAVSGFDPDQDGGMHWRADRLAEGYEPDFDIDYEQGRQGELFVRNLVASIGTERIEVKTDAVAAKTGQVFIELECRRRPSGIQTSKSEFWAFVLPGDFVIIAKTSAVRELALMARAQGRVKECMRGSHPTVGAVVRLHNLVAFLRDAGGNQA